MPNRLILGICCIAALALAGCGPDVTFPARPLTPAEAQGAVQAYDTDASGAADFFLYADAAGRLNRLGYDTTGDAAADTIVQLDEIPASRCRHLVIILDGFAYDVVNKHYDAGGLRMFHRPSRVIAPYPTMTDLALEDVFDYVPCQAFEAKYYDRRQGKVVGGSTAYLAGRNEPYNRLIQYRAGLLTVPFLYLWPRPIFEDELDACKRTFDKAATQEMIAYFSSTAGMGTRLGAKGQVESLDGIERLIKQVLHETRGMTKITMLSDHGHGYKPTTRIDFKSLLAEKGWRLTGRIEGPRDAVLIEFGLTTYASFYTNSRADLAADLVTVPGVKLASYADGEAAVVLAPGEDGPQRAAIRKSGGRFSYEAAVGDPLGLKPILAQLTADKDGYYDPDELLVATVTHDWPAAPERIWRAHFALVENPADVIVSLADDACVGSKFFATFVHANSTHGSLNRINSTAFIMSTAGPLPAFMRSGDVPKHLARLFGRPWPMRK